MNNEIPPPHMLILGTSARAAAWSAQRAGFLVTGADPFNDIDLKAVAQAVAVSNYPHSLPNDLLQWANTNPIGATWDELLLTGAMENHIETVSAVCELFPKIHPGDNFLAGISRSRDVCAWTEHLAGRNFPFLAVSKVGPGSGDWFWKPIHSGGGRAVARCRTNEQVIAESQRDSFAEPAIFQQRGTGVSMSAVIVALPNRPAQVLGVTRQLIGWQPCPWEFSWCGSIGPIHLPADGLEQIACIAEALRNFCELSGLFGIDFLWDGSTPYVTEINPRYPGSLEVLESALGISAIGMANGLVSDATPIRRRTFVAKRIVYAEQETIAGDLTRMVRSARILEALRNEKPLPWLADIPQPGTFIPRGYPLCTVLATSATYRTCLHRIHRRTRVARALLTTHRD